MGGSRSQRATVSLGVTFILLACAGTAVASFAPLDKGTRSDRRAETSSSPQLIDCSSAPAIQIGDSVDGSTIGMPSNIDSYGCSSWPETGGEVVYSLSLSEPAMFEVRLIADCDLDIAILSSCDAIEGCLLVADTGMQTTIPTMGDFFIVVDGYEGAECDFTLEVVATGPASVALAACQTAMPLDCESSSTISGDTCFGVDYVRALGCEAFRSAGTEDWYRVTLEPGGVIDVDLTMPDADAVLWVLGGCGEAAACLAYSDAGVSGEQESVHYSNDGLENRTVFLVVDSYGPASCGGYEASVVCSGTIVPTRSTSWSALKSRSMRGEQ